MLSTATVVAISPNWRRVQQHLRDTLHPFVDEPGHLCIAWSIGTEPAIERQTQVVELAHTSEGLHVRILCEVTHAMAISPLDALAHNASLAFGALAMIDDRFFLRTMLPLDDLSIATLDKALRLTSHEAARIRHLTRPRACASVHIVD
jgi:hypothetical protein